MKEFFSICLIVLTVSSCTQRDTTPSFTGETPASALVDSKQISIYKYPNAYNGAALGYEFKTTTDGHVTGLGCASPAIGSYILTVFKVDTVNKSGTQIAKLPIEFTTSDTVNFKFKYVYLSSKVPITKGNYYRVAINGDFTAYDYMTFPSANKSLPLISPTNPNIIFTKGVSGYSMLYPDAEYNTYMFPADVVLQFP